MSVFILQKASQLSVVRGYFSSGKDRCRHELALMLRIITKKRKEMFGGVSSTPVSRWFTVLFVSLTYLLLSKKERKKNGALWSSRMLPNFLHEEVLIYYSNQSCHVRIIKVVCIHLTKSLTV